MESSFKAKFTLFHTCGSLEQCMESRKKTSNTKSISAIQTHNSLVFSLDILFCINKKLSHHLLTYQNVEIKVNYHIILSQGETS